MFVEIGLHASPLSVAPSRIIRSEPGVSLDLFLKNHCQNYSSGKDQPVLLMINGSVIDPELWSGVVFAPGDCVDIRPRPLDPVTIGIAIVIGIAAALAVNALIDIPDIPAIPDFSEPSPTYSANVQGNRARLGSPIPDRYGRRKFAPDFAHDRYAEFVGNNEYWHLLYAVGQGSYDYHAVFIGNTLIDNFEDVEYAFYEPGERITLFPSSVYSANEVSGQGVTLFGPNEDDYSGLTGPFVANLADTSAEFLAVDLDFPQGLGRTQDDGTIEPVYVEILFEYREIDIDGNPVGAGSWLELYSNIFEGKSFDRIRFTQKLPVSAGRFEVRARRVSNASSSAKTKDDVIWTGLRAYLVDDNSLDHSVLAVRIRSTAQLSAISERRVFVECTRRLPIWNGTQWLIEQATRNPAWAMVNIIKSKYGGDYSDSNLNLEAFLAFAQGCESRGDFFDGHFDIPGTLWKNLQQTANAARAYPLLLGSRFSVVRDEPNVAEVFHFSSRHIVKGSSVMRYKTLDQWADDSVEVEYTDSSTWLPETVVASLPGSDALRPQKVKMPWVTDRTQAFREAMFMAAKQSWRNRFLDFETELEGRLLRPLVRLIVVQEFIDWGSGGDVIGQSVDRLTLSEPPTFESGVDHFIWLRDRRGRSSDALAVIPVPGQYNQVQVLDVIPDWIYTIGSEYERTSFAFGSASKEPKQLLLESGRPSGENRFRLTAVLDDPRVYQYDDQINAGVIQPADIVPAPILNDKKISSVNVLHGGTVTTPVVRVSWAPVLDASSYLVGIRTSLTATWERVYEGALNSVDLVLEPGQTFIRIAAKTDELGEWYELSVEAGAGFDTPLTPSGLQLTEVFSGKTARIEWVLDELAASYRVIVIDTDLAPRIDRVVTGAKFELGFEEALLNGLSREFSVEVYSVNENGVQSDVPATISLKNDQMPLLDGITIIADLRQIQLIYDRPTIPDFAGVRVWISDTTGFDIGATPYYEQTDAAARSLSIPVPDVGTYFVRIAAFDVWGRDELTVSGELTDILQGIRDSDLNALLSERIALIDTPDTGLLDRMLSETSLRESADTNLQQQLDSLSVSSDVPIYLQDDEPTGDIAEKSRWFDSNDGNRPYLRINGVWVDSSDQRIVDNAAAIVAEQAVRASSDDALASSFDSLNAVVTDAQSGLSAAHAAISNEAATRADADTALAQQANTLSATLNHADTGLAAAHAAVQEEQIARVSADSLIAQSVQTLQLTVGDNSGSIQSQTQAIADLDGAVSGISLEYSLRLDNDGYVIGYGAYNDGPGASGFLFKADQFAVGMPGSVGSFPFYVFGNQTYMNEAYIRELNVDKLVGDTASFIALNTVSLDVNKLIGDTASFVETNIENASIDTLKLAGNAVTVAQTVNIVDRIVFYDPPQTGSWVDVVNMQLPASVVSADEAFPILINMKGALHMSRRGTNQTQSLLGYRITSSETLGGPRTVIYDSPLCVRYQNSEHVVGVGYVLSPAQGGTGNPLYTGDNSFSNFGISEMNTYLVTQYSGAEFDMSWLGSGIYAVMPAGAAFLWMEMSAVAVDDGTNATSIHFLRAMPQTGFSIIGARR